MKVKASAASEVRNAICCISYNNLDFNLNSNLHQHNLHVVVTTKIFGAAFEAIFFYNKTYTKEYCVQYQVVGLDQQSNDIFSIYCNIGYVDYINYG